MRGLAISAAVIWSLTAVFGAALTYVIVKFGDEPPNPWAIGILTIVPLLAAIASGTVPFRLRANGNPRAAYWFALVALILSVAGVLALIYLFSPAHPH